jgi:hypothetical protein
VELGLEWCMVGWDGMGFEHSGGVWDCLVLEGYIASLKTMI